MVMPPRLRAPLFTAILLGLGLVGGLLAAGLGAPMPFMLGALAASGLSAGLGGHLYPRGYGFPARLRLLFIGIIGVAIGARVDAGFLVQGREFLVSLAAVSLFVVLAQGLNFLIFRRLGRLDPVTAWFSGSPGGLIEAVTMGEAAGGDPRMLTLLQFLRIILVVSALPFALSIWHGAPVGSAAGLSLSVAGTDPLALAWVVGLAVLGSFLGLRLHLPAGQLTGPLVLAAMVSWFGLAGLGFPGWLMAAAQVVVGVSLGARFHGVSRRLLARAAGLSLVSVSAMLAIGAALAEIVHLSTGLPLVVLIISYAPGGVTEMGLVAISLAANPTLVAMHHLYRITVTVVFLAMGRRLGVLPSAKQAQPDPDREH